MHKCQVIRFLVLEPKKPDIRRCRQFSTFAGVLNNLGACGFALERGCALSERSEFAKPLSGFSKIVSPIDILGLRNRGKLPAAPDVRKICSSLLIFKYHKHF